MAAKLIGHVKDITRPNSGCCRIETRLTKKGDEACFLIATDVHFDHAKCQRHVLAHHLEQAIEREAMVILPGDFFCAMQGKWDKRQSRDALLEEYQSGQYLDRLVDVASQWIEPYAKHIAVISYGNHETAILKRHETDLIQRLHQNLIRMGSPAVVGGYEGWISVKNASHTRRSGLKMRYTHGYGGGGPVTDDTIQAHRQRARIDGADIMFSGHTHGNWEQWAAMHRLDDNDKPYIRDCLYMKCGTYKCAFDGGAKGTSWEAEKGHPPKPIGGRWLYLGLDKDRLLSRYWSVKAAS